MPSTFDMIRLRDKLTHMDPKTRQTVLTDTLRWLDTVAVNFQDTEQLDDFIDTIKYASTAPTLSDTWVQTLTPRFGTRLYFEAFTRRLR